MTSPVAVLVVVLSYCVVVVDDVAFETVVDVNVGVVLVFEFLAWVVNVVVFTVGAVVDVVLDVVVGVNVECVLELTEAVVDVVVGV
jgi:hypothetical protein